MKNLNINDKIMIALGLIVLIVLLLQFTPDGVFKIGVYFILSFIALILLSVDYVNNTFK